MKQRFVKPLNKNQDKKQPLYSYNSRANNYFYSPEQDDKESFKPKIYEPNLLNSSFNEEQFTQNKVSLYGFIEVSLSKISQRYKSDGFMFLHIKDLIKYKCESFSARLMAPILSDWREGEIIEINKEQLIIKRNMLVDKHKISDEEIDEEESDEDELFLHNLRALYISGSSLDQERKSLIMSEFKEESKKEDDQKEIANRKKKA